MELRHGYYRPGRASVAEQLGIARVVEHPDEAAPAVTEGGLRREPELSEHDAAEHTPTELVRNEFETDEGAPDDEAVRHRALSRQSSDAATSRHCPPAVSLKEAWRETSRFGNNSLTSERSLGIVEIQDSHLW